MPTYEITGPNGEVFEVTAPEGASESDVLSYAKQAMQGQRGSVVDPLKQGVTWGWADELGAAGAYAGARMGGASHERAMQASGEELNRQRDDLSAYRDRNPGTSMAAEFASGMVSGVPAMKGAKAIPDILARGTGMGAVAGAGSADKDKLQSSLLGGLLGFGLTGALPLAGALTTKGLQVGNERLIRPLRDRFAKDPTSAAARVTQQAFDGMTPAQVASKQRQLGPMATPADIGGPRVTGLAQGVIGQSGKAASNARELDRVRRAGQSTRLAEDIGNATGNKQRLLTALDDVKARQRDQAGAAYRASNAVQIAPDDELIAILNRPAARDALPLVLKDAANEGRTLPQLEKIIMQGDDWRVSSENFPDMQGLDLLKKKLDGLYSAAVRSSDSATRSTAGGIKAVRDALRNKLDDLNPEYRKAREIYAGSAAVKDALEEGENFLTRKPREVTEFVRDLSNSEREAYLTGAVEAIRTKMGRARSGEMGAFRFLETEGVKEKLRMLFPKGREGDKQMAAIMRTLQRERTFAENQNLWTGGSQTALRDAGAKLLGNDVLMPGSAEAISSPMRASLSAAMATGKNLLGGQSQNTVDYLGDMLFTPNNQQELLSLLSQKGLPTQTIAQLQAKYGRIPGMFAPSVGLLGAATQR